MRVLICHPKNIDDGALTEIKSAFQRLAAANDVVTLGREDFDQFFKYDGSWNAWAIGAAQRHEAFLVIALDAERSVGKATAQIIESALLQNKPVRVTTNGEVFRTVTSVRQVADDYKNGFRLNCA